MDELFRQIAFIDAVMGGFAITFLSVLLTWGGERRRVLHWMIALLIACSTCFIVSAIGATFSAAAAAQMAPEELPHEVAVLHVPISLLFLLGAVFLFATLGLCGWLRSRRLGIATTSLAGLALLGAFLMLRPFLQITTL